jgi:hypothetical protein
MMNFTMLSEGLTMLSEGLTMLSEGLTMLRKSLTMLSEGLTMLSEGLTMLSEGHTMLIFPKRLMVPTAKIGAYRMPFHYSMILKLHHHFLNIIAVFRGRLPLFLFEYPVKI